ncbi:putative zinc-binding metallopeptidase [Stella sp.]|uniref:zinc-binding metallopeptidase family protein n=1 Tax=Stella sp. TaxID=2912054 RepID=UPI0035B2EEBA
MKLFECQNCGQPLYFENDRCMGCGLRLGYLPDLGTMSALRPDGDGWQVLAAPERRHRDCVNAAHGTCNWLVPADQDEALCRACRHNRTIPDLSAPRNLDRWRRLEIAKHRLFYTLLALGLPLANRSDDPANGLAFDFLADPPQPHGPRVLTGHDNGLVTINLAEADDAERERIRAAMGEPYRTLLGHLRHEVGHWFWDRLVGGQAVQAEFRGLFGDESVDYAEALARHYADGPPSDWQDRFVSAYASAHPWEDFAETWAHYLHIVDTLETARAFGLRIQPRIGRGPEIAARIDFDPNASVGAERLVDAWLPLTFAVNSLNRSMGQPDLYPFVLAPPVIEKLDFVDRLVHQPSG